MTHSQSLLGDLPSHSDFSSAADELLAKTRQWRKDEFEKWCVRPPRAWCAHTARAVDRTGRDEGRLQVPRPNVFNCAMGW